MARENKPSVIFIDQVDSIFCSQKGSESNRRVKAEFIFQMNGMCHLKIF